MKVIPRRKQFTKTTICFSKRWPTGNRQRPIIRNYVWFRPPQIPVRRIRFSDEKWLIRWGLIDPQKPGPERRSQMGVEDFLNRIMFKELRQITRRITYLYAEIPSVPISSATSVTISSGFSRSNKFAASQQRCRLPKRFFRTVANTNQL